MAFDHFAIPVHIWWHVQLHIITRCLASDNYDSWEFIGFPCSSCQLTSIIYRNPFGKRFERLLNTWLPTSSGFDSSSDDNESNTAQTPRIHSTTGENCHVDMLIKMTL
jgi:hypothetical protein